MESTFRGIIEPNIEPIFANLYLTFMSDDTLHKNIMTRKDNINKLIKNVEKCSYDQRNEKFETWF